MILTFRCLLGESFPGTSCRPGLFCTPAPPKGGPREDAGTCQRGSAGRNMKCTDTAGQTQALLLALPAEHTNMHTAPLPFNHQRVVGTINIKTIDCWSIGLRQCGICVYVCMHMRVRVYVYVCVLVCEWACVCTRTRLASLHSALLAGESGGRLPARRHVQAEVWLVGHQGALWGAVPTRTNRNARQAKPRLLPSTINPSPRRAAFHLTDSLSDWLRRPSPGEKQPVFTHRAQQQSHTGSSGLTSREPRPPKHTGHSV